MYEEYVENRIVDLIIEGRLRAAVVINVDRHIPMKFIGTTIMVTFRLLDTGETYRQVFFESEEVPKKEASFFD